MKFNFVQTLERRKFLFACIFSLALRCNIKLHERFSQFSFQYHEDPNKLASAYNYLRYS